MAIAPRADTGSILVTGRTCALWQVVGEENALYDEMGADGRRLHTVQRIAEEFGVTRPTIYRHLQRQNGGAGPAS